MMFFGTPVEQRLWSDARGTDFLSILYIIYVTHRQAQACPGRGQVTLLI